MLRRTVLLLAVVVLLVGCTKVPLPKVGEGLTLLQITIDWSQFDDAVDRIGVRLVYPGEKAVFTQAVSKQAIIALRVPATNLANLYLVGVSEGTRTAFHYAIAEGLRLESDALLSMTLDDFRLVEAMWTIEAAYASALEKEYFELPFNEEQVLVKIEVRDPFQEGKKASYETSLIGHQGVSSMRNNVNGWLGFDAYFRNPSPGVPNLGRQYMQPCVNGSAFNLGNKGYYIPPVIADVLVEWK